MNSKAFFAAISIGALLLSACSRSENRTLDINGDSQYIFQEKTIQAVGLNKTIALTIDDGPTTNVTDALLDLLEKEGIKASFFLNGKNIHGRESTVIRMRNEGHVIANHAHHHNSLRKVSASERGMQGVFEEINDSHQALTPYLQDGGRLYFRPPEGAWKPEFAPYLNDDQVLRDYIGPVLWDIGGQITRGGNGDLITAADWDCWRSAHKPAITVGQCAAAYVNETVRRNGGIMLAHDVKMQSVEMLKFIIPRLKAQGYKFVTLDEIPQLEKYTH